MTREEIEQILNNNGWKCVAENEKGNFKSYSKRDGNTIEISTNNSGLEYHVEVDGIEVILLDICIDCLSFKRGYFVYDGKDISFSFEI